MNNIAAAQTWIYCIGPDEALPKCEITTALEQGGVTITSLRPHLQMVPGVLLCNEVTPAVCDSVRTFAQNGRERILVVLTHADLAQDAFWQLIAAGASDVLAWNRLPNPANMILSRLQRWRAVDEIVASPRVHDHLVGESPAWISLLRQVVEVGLFTDSSVLLVGETGTGKELVAHLIHTLSSVTHNRKFVILDCTTIVPELSGSELFGHERGAFTGAVTARDGAFATADGGTLFLDEVEELPLGLQSQLLRVLQEHTYKRIGSNIWHNTDFRLVCASNRDLMEEQVQGRFRRDLYYRLASWVFRLPSLAERAEDILPLARHFMAQMYPDRDLVELDAPVQEFLSRRAYPGNVRDLRSLIQRIAHRHVGDGPITIGDIPADERPARVLQSSL